MEAVLMQQHVVVRRQPEDARHQAGECHERWGAEAGLVCTAHAQSCPGSRRVQP